MLLRMDAYKPRTKQVFHCACCDHYKVDSEDETTGRFFVMAGHTFNRQGKEYDGEYNSVMFAYCRSCLTLV